MGRWFLVRHAQSVANVEGWFSGHTDVGLTVIGYHEAVGLSMRLRGERITRVISSDLERASETAHTAMRGRSHAVRCLPELRERDMGAWTGWPLHRLDHTEGWHVLRDLDGRPPGGESLRDVARRATGALARFDDGLPTLVVAHGGLLRALLGLLDGDVDPHVIGKRFIPNATPFVRDLPVGRWAALHRSLG